jgi:hypothetical protein
MGPCVMCCGGAQLGLQHTLILVALVGKAHGSVRPVGVSGAPEGWWSLRVVEKVVMAVL